MTVNESDARQLSCEGRDQTSGSIFNRQVWSSSMAGSIKRTWTSGLTHRPTPAHQARVRASVHLGLPGLEFPVALARSPGNYQPTKETTSLAGL